jgi:hypothetical protein
MKKVFFLLIFGSFSLANANAQKGSNDLKIHAGAEMPIGDFSDAYNIGWGLHLTDYISLNDKGGFLVTTGFTSWKDKLGANIKAGLLLIRGGYRQFVSKGFYFQGEAGTAIILQDWGKGSRFSFGGGAGYLFKTKGKGAIDISVLFNRITYRTWIGLGIGYQFKLK